MAETKGVLEESLPDEASRSQSQEAMCQAGDQLQWVRDTIAHHTVEITQMEQQLKENETSEEESSSPEDDPSLEPGAWNNPTQEEDVDMEDDENTPDPPPETGTETDPTTTWCGRRC